MTEPATFKSRLTEFKTDLALLMDQYSDVTDIRLAVEKFGAGPLEDKWAESEYVENMRINGWVLIIESYDVEDLNSSVISISPSMQSDAHTEGIANRIV